jgi:cell division protease FtsH
MSFGKNRAYTIRKQNKITFKDVAGIEEAKEEVQEIVEFLKSRNSPDSEDVFQKGFYS